jgi:hypothetical protein
MPLPRPLRVPRTVLQRHEPAAPAPSPPLGARAAATLAARKVEPIDPLFSLLSPASSLPHNQQDLKDKFREVGNVVYANVQRSEDGE